MPSTACRHLGIRTGNLRAAWWNLKRGRTGKERLGEWHLHSGVACVHPPPTYLLGMHQMIEVIILPESNLNMISPG